MTREEKCKLAIEKGFTYDEVTGNIYGIRGKKIDRKNSGYINIAIRDEEKNDNFLNLSGHQFAYYYKYGKVVDCIDHIDGNRSNNKIDNLREVTNQQNQFNRRGKGYYFNKDKNKYISYITIDKKKIHLGLYETEQEARQVYLDAKQKYHII